MKENTCKIFLKKYWKSILVVCLIFYVSLLHQSNGEPLKFIHQDKLIHLIMYFTLSSALYLDTVRAKSALKKLTFMLVVLAFPILYGSLIEIIQGTFTSTRTADIYDALANTIGSLLAFIITPIFIKK